MTFFIFTVALLVLSIGLPIGLYFAGAKTQKRFKRSLALNVVAFFSLLLFATAFAFSGAARGAEAPAPSAFPPGGGFDRAAGGPAAGEQDAVAQGSLENGLRYIAAALSVGLGSIGAGVATGKAASAALGALSENEAIFGKSMIFVALAEGVAVYGLIIAILMLMG
ncbi:MAG: ATP synthase subunit C [Peptococcaceae bacterium]|jgi:V/A-type H+-transporting ATPase subunit K|nr:ATP synthase subunit C [Peptococcaceae bacterium]